MTAVTKPVTFFVPSTPKREQEAVYQSLVAFIKDQMRWTISERRIYSLTYVHDKRRYHLTVGECEPQEDRYTVYAILESSSFIAMTRDAQGRPGINILVNKDEVESQVDFLPVVTKTVS